jgi:hypothetical protein
MPTAPEAITKKEPQQRLFFKPPATSGGPRVVESPDMSAIKRPKRDPFDVAKDGIEGLMDEL